MFWKLAVRDLVFVSAVALLWRYAAPHSAGDGMLADFLGVVLGFGVGASAYLAHEWGHLLGALAGRSEVRPPERLGSVYLFSFDSRSNSRRQFLIMSFSGFAVTGAAIAVAYLGLPDGLLATRVARGGVMFLTALTVFIEFPLVIWSLLRPSLPPVETFPSHREEHKAAA